MHQANLPATDAASVAPRTQVPACSESSLGTLRVCLQLCKARSVHLDSSSGDATTLSIVTIVLSSAKRDDVKVGD